MTQVFAKLDPSYYDDEAIWDLEHPIAEMLYVRSIAYAKRKNTDGHIPARAVRRLCIRIDEYGTGHETLANDLVTVGLWDESDDGYQIVSWSKWQTTVAEQTEITAKKSRGGLTTAHNKGAHIDAPKDGCPLCESTPVEQVLNRCSTAVEDPGTAVEDSSSREEKRRVELTTSSTATPTDVTHLSGYPPAFEEAWNQYPRKEGKKAAHKAWRARRKQGATPEELHTATEHFARAMTNRNSEHIKVGSTFYGPNDHWRDYLDPASAKPNQPTGEYTPGNDQFVA